MVISKAIIVVAIIIITGLILTISIMPNDPFSTKEPQTALPVGVYYHGANYLELKPDGTYLLHEEIDHEGPYLIEKTFIYLKVTDGALWGGRKFQIINSTTLKDYLEGNIWQKK